MFAAHGSKAATRHPFIRTVVFIRVASLVLLLSCVTVYIRGQTSIVVYKNSTQIIAGTDSKARKLDGSSFKVCKISREGKLFWAMSGTSAEIRPVIIASRKDTTTIRQVVENFCSIFPPAWTHALEQNRAASPKDFKHFMQIDGGIEKFIFFGMDKKTPVVAYVGIAATEDSKHRLTIQVNKDIRDTLCESDECGFMIGDDEAIRRDIAKRGGLNEFTGAEIQRLIQLEIDDDPERVGPPIRILQIDADGPRWTLNGEGCHTGIKGESKATLTKSPTSTTHK